MLSGEADEARKPAGYSYIGKHMIAEFFADVDTMNVDPKHPESDNGYMLFSASAPAELA